jgi:hypothetical protein
LVARIMMAMSSQKTEVNNHDQVIARTRNSEDKKRRGHAFDIIPGHSGDQ